MPFERLIQRHSGSLRTRGTEANQWSEELAPCWLPPMVPAGAAQAIRCRTVSRGLPQPWALVLQQGHDALEISNCLLIRFEDCSTERNLYLLW